MTAHVPLEPRSVFTPHAVASLNRAYARVIDLLGPGTDARDKRIAVAEHMMMLARNGESDERRLCRLSILAVLGEWPATMPDDGFGWERDPQGGCR